MKEIRPIVLFVDDEELARRTFERMVSKDFRVLLAADVDDAQKVLAEHHEEIGVLLTDQRMPGKLGVDLLVHCRDHYPNIVRMLTTAYSELNDAIAAVNKGEILRYIEKPWGNIDSILIDLNLAATIYEIKKENQQLLDEKLMVGFKTSQLEKLRTLITVAASQDSKNNLFAVETLLRQVAEVLACYEAPAIDELRSFQMFGQPLSNTISAIELAKEVSKGTDNSAVPEVAEILAQDSGLLTQINEDKLAQILTNGLLALQQSAKIESSENELGAELLLLTQQGGSACIKEWFCNPDMNTEGNIGIGALLNVYLAVFDLGGRAELRISEAGLLEAIQIRFAGKNASAQPSSTGRSYDWIDDLMILFT